MLAVASSQSQVSSDKFCLSSVSCNAEMGAGY